MQKLTVKAIIEFRNRTEKSKKNFAASLKVEKEKKSTEGGGNYWASSISALRNSFKANDISLVKKKIDDLQESLSTTTDARSKGRIKKNIDILSNYVGFDLKRWRPSKKLKFHKQRDEDSILTIKGFPVQVAYKTVVVFQLDDSEEIGAIWFVAKINGYKKNELGMFADLLHRYLKTAFSGYTINPKYCIAVDVFNTISVNDAQLGKAGIPRILSSTLDEIARMI